MTPDNSADINSYLLGGLD